MATFAEHALADFAKALAEAGATAVIDSESLRVFVTTEEQELREAEGIIVAKKKIFHLPSDLSTKVPGQRIEVDGDGWLVMGHYATTIGSVCLSIERVIA